jgi:hypothetical protein
MLTFLFLKFRSSVLKLHGFGRYWNLFYAAHSCFESFPATLKKIVASSFLVLNILVVWRCGWGPTAEMGTQNTFVCPCSQTSRHVWAPRSLIICRDQSAGVELICSCALLDVWIPQLSRSLLFPCQPDLTLFSQCGNCYCIFHNSGVKHHFQCISYGIYVGMCGVYILAKKTTNALL